jgi:photosystem II stability/assembly factor-like uncharacterized protein
VPQMATSGPITVRLPETGESAVTAQDFTVTIVGSPWTPVASVGQTLSGVTFADNSNGIVVGNLGTAYRTTDGGFTWSPLNTGTSEPLMDVSFANMNIGYAVGENGTVLRTADFGDNWASINGVTTRDLYGVSTPDDSTVFVAGQAGSVLRSIDNGITWQAVNTGGQTNYDIWFATKDTGFVATQQGQVKSTFNGGQTWTNRYNRASGEFFQAISFADMLTGLAVGTPGIGEIVKTVDGGLTWSPQSSGTTEILRGVSVFSGDPQIGIAVGDNGTVFRTTDGGLNWTQENSGVSENLRAVCIIDANVAIIVGSFGTVFRRE